MKTFVYFRFSTPGDSAARGTWTPRTSYSDPPETVMKKLPGIVEQEYTGVNPDHDSVPIGIMLVYFHRDDLDASDPPKILEYDIKIVKPQIVEVRE